MATKKRSPTTNSLPQGTPVAVSMLTPLDHIDSIDEVGFRSRLEEKMIMIFGGFVINNHL